MGEGAEARAFDVVSAPIGTSGAEFSDIARAIASVDTLDAFLRDMRARYPESRPLPAGEQPPASAPPPQSGKPNSDTTGAVAPRLPAAGARVTQAPLAPNLRAQ
jgi:hypothetical protein